MSYFLVFVLGACSPFAAGLIVLVVKVGLPAWRLAGLRKYSGGRVRRLFARVRNAWQLLRQELARIRAQRGPLL